jgi:hypothetical protein
VSLVSVSFFFFFDGRARKISIKKKRTLFLYIRYFNLLELFLEPFCFSFLSLSFSHFYFIKTMTSYQAFPVLNQQFIVDKKYQFIREMGQGAYGVVW